MLSNTSSSRCSALGSGTAVSAPALSSAARPHLRMAGSACGRGWRVAPALLSDPGGDIDVDPAPGPPSHAPVVHSAPLGNALLLCHTNTSHEPLSGSVDCTSCEVHLPPRSTCRSCSQTGWPGSARTRRPARRLRMRQVDRGGVHVVSGKLRGGPAGSSAEQAEPTQLRPQMSPSVGGLCACSAMPQSHGAQHSAAQRTRERLL